MQREMQSGNQHAAYNPMYFMAMLQMQMVARQTIQRLESLCEQYPDPSLQEAVEALRREEQEWQGCVEAAEVPGDWVTPAQFSKTRS